jgi:phosphotriesterase-related protein
MVIQTVTGPIDPSELGVTLPHEHLLVESPAAYTERPPKKDADLFNAPITLANYRRMLRGVFYSTDALNLNDEQLAIDELKMFKRAGGSTLVDLSVNGQGRNPAALKRISVSTGVRVIMGTGFFIQSSHPMRVKTATVENLADEMIRDLQAGAGDTGVRAGIMGEIGVSRGGILPQEEKVLRATAIAHGKTKRPINVHTWGDPPENRTQIRVLDILEEGGVPPQNVALSHMEQVKIPGPIPLTDWNYIASLAERGAYVLLDGFGQEWPWGASWSLETKNFVYMPSPTDFERARGVITLLDKGCGKRILLSHDVWHKLRLKHYGGDGYDHLLVNVIPILKFLGMKDETIRQLTIDNPREYLK